MTIQIYACSELLRGYRQVHHEKQIMKSSLQAQTLIPIEQAQPLTHFCKLQEYKHAKDYAYAIWYKGQFELMITKIYFPCRAIAYYRNFIFKITCKICACALEYFGFVVNSEYLIQKDSQSTNIRNRIPEHLYKRLKSFQVTRFQSFV